MNATVCAPNNIGFGQFRFNWTVFEDNVKELQARIVKAWREGRHNKVKALQWILKHSFSAKILAVKRVTQNRGKKTPGIDGILWTTDRDKLNAVRNLNTKIYQARPLKRVFIPKKNGKKRPLGIPIMKDRAMQALYLQALDPVAETIMDNDSYGFRKGRGAADAIKRIFMAVRGNRFCAEWVIEGDIKGCFDHIDHDWLIGNVPLDEYTLRQWLKAGIILNRKYSRTKTGTPQGGIISPCLANLALNGLGSLLAEKFMRRKVVNYKEINNKVHTIVYADDFIVTGKSKELLQDEVLPVIRGFMSERGLELSEEKTKITHIRDGFDFLGQNIRKYNDGKVLIKPSKANLKAFLDNIRELIKKNPTASQEILIDMLNPKIRGWANYHRHVNSKKIYSYVDYHIFEVLWSWCKRRHPKKGKRWIKNRYFHSIGTRLWVFAVRKGKDEVKELIRAADTKIVRHVKIKGEANPYDPEWDLYFEEREGDRMFCSMKGRKQLKAMWKKQGRRCPVCGNVINKESGWKVHKDKSNGRKAIIHPECHKLIHSEIKRYAG